jgi:hypothetical protein
MSDEAIAKGLAPSKEAKRVTSSSDSKGPAQADSDSVMAEVVVLSSSSSSSKSAAKVAESGMLPPLSKVSLNNFLSFYCVLGSLRKQPAQIEANASNSSGQKPPSAETKSSSASVGVDGPDDSIVRNPSAASPASSNSAAKPLQGPRNSSSPRCLLESSLWTM